MSFTQSYFYPTIITNITQLNGGLYGTVKPTDVYPAVDTTDVTQSPYGTTKPYQIIQLFNYIITNLGYIVYSPVLASTVGNLMATYNNGASGVGATLTNSGTLSAFILDGIPGVLNGTYLVKNQTAPAQNGLYTLTTVGDSVSVNWVLTRSINFNQTANIFEDGIVFVQYGFTNGGTFWQDSFSSPITVGTTAINWNEWSPSTEGGMVNAGEENELAWYPMTGTEVSGLPTADNGVLVTSNTGVPSISSTLPEGLTIPGYQTSLIFPLAISLGGTSVDAVTTAPTAISWAGWDANKNLSAVGFIPGYSKTVTSATTTTLTVGSNQQQYFTGSTTQTVQMPVASTCVVGQYWSIVNNSTGVVTIVSSGSNTILALPASSETVVTCVLASGTTAASWETSPAVSGSGTVNAGTINDLAYYAATGTAVSPLATANYSVLQTNGSGVPSISTLQSIYDSNGNKVLVLNGSSSAVNYAAFGNAATTLAPQLASEGSDTNISLGIAAKGTGNIIFGSGNGGDNVILNLFGNVSSPVNYLSIIPSATTNPVTIAAGGSDTNINLLLEGRGTSGVLIKGATNGSSISSGYVGNIVTSNVPFASAVSLTTATAKDVTTISLSAGNWYIFGNIFMNFPSNTGSAPAGWISTTSATTPDFSTIYELNLVSSLISSLGFTVPSTMLNLSTTTSVYLSGSATFASGTGTACGTITAIRLP